jgi:hypothetical protein
LRKDDAVLQPQIRHFFIVRHKGEEFNRTYYVTTGTSNDNDISARTVLGCIGVTDAYMNIRPIKAREQPTTQDEIDALKTEIKKTRKVVEPGTIVKINDIYDNACAMWQKDLFFSLLEILEPEPIVVSEPMLSYKDLSNLHTFIRNFPSWKCLQFSAAIGGGWWDQRVGFQNFVLNSDYNADQRDAKFVLRVSPFRIEVAVAAQSEDRLHLLLLTGDEKEIIPEMFAEMVPSLKAPPLLKQYLLVLSIVGNVKSLAGLSSTYSSQQKEGEQKINKENLINEIVSLCPEKIANPVRITLNGLKNNEGLFKFFQDLLLNMPKGGRPKIRKKRRTKRLTKRRTKKSKKRKL